MENKGKKSDGDHAPGASPREIGERIKMLRDSHGLTQEGLAEVLVSLGASATTQKSTVSKWEKGEIENIANTTLYFLVKALHTTHQHLLFGQKGEPKPRPIQRRKPASGD